jgi:pyruvate kinase
MLSAESAAGKYPVESVTMQQLIINKVEVSLLALTLVLTLTLVAEHLREILTGGDDELSPNETVA